ncbi:MAG: transcription termination/antitermination protein NusA [Ardenticatenaceae bacterium]|nr:transcription termination/antitermination protein NusA [Ardenticatenaceae bacterium]MCB8987476.1 transcription termination/antitermination protein NusA [Ardenticatenaceae bacterium]
MKSEFVLAFNEICEARGLPKEDVFEALKTALVSAYRRDLNLSSTQDVRVEIDPRTGESTIFAEKEVVDSIIDNRTEVLLDVARREHPNAELGDVLLVDSTTAQFGRIAAQTAKQVLLQRVREAEREHLFEDFSGREGELVNGTVQSISGQHITIGLGRTEATLPKGQQVPGERYRAHDKIRVYVLEVRRTNRGPQIFVSRNHRNLLRRLLELEVPEIYNGQVEIKSIAREAGQRSKVAVQALQPGVDPVGACVGMRGVRIQSIVRELNDEKIDVIEWDSDQHTFIAKALSPARVSHVFLEEHPEDGKTAIVIVPDDQLSLAIGREGQNARLAAKLTGWRIDIKSLTEAAAESLDNLDHPQARAEVVKNTNLIELVQQILDKKAANRPITSEDYHTLDRLVSGVLGAIITSRAENFEKTRKRRAEARQHVPVAAWHEPLDTLDLPGRIHNLLLDNDIETVGDAIFHLELGDEVILGFRGLGEAALETLKERVADYYATLTPAEPVAEAELEVELAVAVEEEEEELETAVAELLEAEVEELEAVEADIEPELEPELIAVEAEAEPEPVAEVEELEAESEEEPVVADVLDDLSRSLIDVVIEEKPEPQKKPKPGIVVVHTEESSEEEEDEEERKRKGRKGRQLVYNEDIGEVVAKRKRKGSRRRPEWEDFDIDDL